MWEDEAAAVRAGLRILVRTQDHKQAMEWLRDMASLPDMRAKSSHRIVDCKSGGFVHFAWRDDQVIGMEYHEARGPVVEVVGLTDVMTTRVRL